MFEKTISSARYVLTAFRMTKEEHGALHSEAKRLKLSASDFMRKLLRDYFKKR